MTTTLSLPSWFDAAEVEMSLAPEVRGFSGPFGGPTEVQDLLGDRWRLRVQMPDGDHRWGGRTEALFNSLRGGGQWLRLHHLARPAPRGTARGSMVLGSSVAQGAASMTVSGLTGGNLVLGGSFEVDSNADGVADGWARYSSGSPGTLSASLTTGMVVAGAKNQSCTASALPSSGGEHGVQQLGIAVAALAGQSVTLAGSVAANGGTRVQLACVWKSGGGSTLGTLQVDVLATGSQQDISATGTCPADAVTADIFAYQYSGGGSSGTILVDVVRLVLGSASASYPAAPTLLAGDMLGHNGEQLFQVYDDATATDAGVITVTTVNRARKAIASGQVIVWDKPSLSFQLLDASGVPTAFTRGRARGQSVEFVEAWT